MGLDIQQACHNDGGVCPSYRLGRVWGNMQRTRHNAPRTWHSAYFCREFPASGRAELYNQRTECNRKHYVVFQLRRVRLGQETLRVARCRRTHTLLLCQVSLKYDGDLGASAGSHDPLGDRRRDSGCSLSYSLKGLDMLR